MKSSLTFIPSATGISSVIKDECLVFTHIPKAAGTTLDRLLKGVGLIKKLPWNRAFGTVYYQFLGKGKGESLDDFLSWPDSVKSDVRIMTGHVPFGAHEKMPRDVKYVTLLRDPVSRMLSHFKMGVGRGGWQANEPLSEVLRKGGLVSDVQVRMLAGITSPHDKVDDAVLERALQNLEEHYFLVGFSDTFNVFTSALLGYLDAPNALLGEEQTSRVKLSKAQENSIKEEAENFNRYDAIFYEKARSIAERKFSEFMVEPLQNPDPENGKHTIVASSQIKFNNSEYSVIPPDQFRPVVNKLIKKGVTLNGL